MTENCYNYVSENLNIIRDKMAAAAIKSGRKPQDIMLVAVTKTVEPPVIQQAINWGITIMGENRVQEMLSKKDSLVNYSGQTHIIGHLQTNKVKFLPGNVHMVQSVDSVKLAQALSSAFVQHGSVLDVLVEVNIGGEESKGGVLPAELENLLLNINGLAGIKVKGLMAIPPISQGQQARGYFNAVHKLFVDTNVKKIDNIDMQILSMGMTHDHEEAIAEGSTMVRIGTGIFGERIYNK